MSKLPEPLPVWIRTDTVHRIDGEALRIVRKARGLSLRALARAAGVSYTYLTDIEIGNKTCSSSPYMEKLLVALERHPCITPTPS